MIELSIVLVGFILIPLFFIMIMKVDRDSEKNHTSKKLSHDSIENRLKREKLKNIK